MTEAQEIVKAVKLWVAEQRPYSSISRVIKKFTIVSPRVVNGTERTHRTGFPIHRRWLG
jgi:hypothetical protein